MAYCSMCMKRGLFLKLDKNGHCADCAVKIAEMEKKRAEEIRIESERRKAEELRLEQERQRAIEAERKRRVEEQRREEAERQRQMEIRKAEELLRIEQQKHAELKKAYISVSEYKAEITVPAAGADMYMKTLNGKSVLANVDLTSNIPITITNNGVIIGVMGKSELASEIADKVLEYLKLGQNGKIIILKEPIGDKPGVRFIFYQERQHYMKWLSHQPNTKVFDLLDSRGDNAQEGLAFVRDGDKVGIEPQGRHLQVYTKMGYEIGRLPVAVFDFVGDGHLVDARIVSKSQGDYLSKTSASILLRKEDSKDDSAND